MAPTKKTSDENIICISNDSFLNNSCPMRTGNVRCRNKSTCALTRGVIDLSAPEKAQILRGRILVQIAALKPTNPTATDPIWKNIQDDVEEVLESVLCTKHKVQLDTSVDQTMFFLKQECGLSRRAQSAQPHAEQLSHHNPPAPQTTPSAPVSSYATAPTHLATPPASPASFQQEQMQQSFSGYPSNPPLQTQSFPTHSYAAPQQPPVVNGFSNSAYTAYAMHAQPSQQSQPGPFDSSAQFGFQVRPRTESNSFGSQSTGSQASFGFTDGGHKFEQDSIYAPTPLSTPAPEVVYPHEQHYAPETAYQDQTHTAQSQIEELTDELRAVKVSNKEFVQAYDQVAADKRALEVENKQLAVALEDVKTKLGNENEQLIRDSTKLKVMCRAADTRADAQKDEKLENERLRSEVRDANDQLNDLKDNIEHLQSDARDADAQIVKLKKKIKLSNSKASIAVQRNFEFELEVEEMKKELAAMRSLLRSKWSADEEL